LPASEIQLVDMLLDFVAFGSFDALLHATATTHGASGPIIASVDPLIAWMASEMDLTTDEDGIDDGLERE